MGSSPGTLPEHSQHAQHSQPGPLHTPGYPIGTPQASSPLHPGPTQGNHFRQQGLQGRPSNADPASMHAQASAMHDAMRSQPHAAAHGKDRLQALLASTPQQHRQLGSEQALNPNRASEIYAAHVPGASPSLPEHFEQGGPPTPNPPIPAASLHDPAPAPAPNPAHRSQHPSHVPQPGGLNRSGMSPVEALKHGLFGQDHPSLQQRSRLGPSPSAEPQQAPAEPMDEDDQGPSGDDSEMDGSGMDDADMDDGGPNSRGAAGSRQPPSHPYSQQSEYTPLEDRQAYYSPRPQLSPPASEPKQQQPAPFAGVPRGGVPRLGSRSRSRSRSPDARNPSEQGPQGRAALGGSGQHTPSEQDRYRQQQELFTQQLQQGKAQASAQQQGPHSTSMPAALKALQPLSRMTSAPRPGPGKPEVALKPLSRMTSAPRPGPRKSEGALQPLQRMTAKPKPKPEGAEPSEGASGQSQQGRQLEAAAAASMAPDVQGPAGLSRHPAGQPANTPQQSGSEDEETEDEAEALQVSISGSFLSLSLGSNWAASNHASKAAKKLPGKLAMLALQHGQETGARCLLYLINARLPFGDSVETVLAL